MEGVAGRPSREPMRPNLAVVIGLRRASTSRPASVSPTILGVGDAALGGATLAATFVRVAVAAAAPRALVEVGADREINRDWRRKPARRLDVELAPTRQMGGSATTARGKGPGPSWSGHVSRYRRFLLSPLMVTVLAGHASVRMNIDLPPWFSVLGLQSGHRSGPRRHRQGGVKPPLLPEGVAAAIIRRSHTGRNKGATRAGAGRDPPARAGRRNCSGDTTTDTVSAGADFRHAGCQCYGVTAQTRTGSPACAGKHPPRGGNADGYSRHRRRSHCPTAEPQHPSCRRAR